ncbi:MAG: hypothetical protein HQK79_17570 [Desulfobacterales bacterium]|nr:hypothetical protein [Desulfobacterales bacterium]
MAINKVIIKILTAVIVIAWFNHFVSAANSNIYYDPTIKNIIMADCSRCHSGAARNLMDYDSLKAYADTGLLASMVSGPMYRFAGNDAQTIIDWANNGAPEKSSANQAGFMQTNPIANSTTPRCQIDIQPINPSVNQITYSNTIQYVFAKDCLRCHSGPFRNLTTYRNVKIYVDNGLLKDLVQIGGQMHRFAGPDSKLIITWINNGAPR